jgi:hypothetical protein
MHNIKEYISYDPLTGIFTRIKNKGRWKAGSIVGYRRKDKRLDIHFNGNDYLAHRLAWWFVYGFIPEYDVDHINEDPTDNRIVNLRLDTNKENGQNISSLRKANTSGYTGVNKHNSKWQAKIGVKDKQIYLGVYDTPKEAHEAYLCAKKEHHPFWVEKETI